MIVMQINDIHIDERPPGQRDSGYFKDIVLKLTECSRIAAEKCGAVVLTGDLFHRKEPSKVTHRTVRVLIKCIRAFNVPVYYIFGNHDVQGGRKSGEARQPIGVVLESKVMKPLQQVMAGETELVGINYDERFEQKKVIIRLPEKEGKRRIIFTHSLLSPERNLRKLIHGPYDLICYGHPHEPEGRDGKFFNPGALARVRTEVWENRRVGVGLIDTETLETEVVTLKHQRNWSDTLVVKPEAELFFDEEKLDKFAKSLLVTEGEEVNEELILREVEPEVRNRVMKYIEELRA